MNKKLITREEAYKIIEEIYGVYANHGLKTMNDIGDRADTKETYDILTSIIENVMHQQTILEETINYPYYTK